MKQFGAFEAKTHFSELLGAVMNGEKFVITKHGVQVAIKKLIEKGRVF
jgi:prevent-host-death family protein